MKLSAEDQKIFKAAKEGDLNQIKSSKQLPTAVNIDGYTILHIAAEYGHLDIINWVLDSGFLDIDETSNYGNTPLHSAASNGQLESMQLLISRGADIENTNHGNQSALDILSSQYPQLYQQYLTIIHTNDTDSSNESATENNSSNSSQINNEEVTDNINLSLNINLVSNNRDSIDTNPMQINGENTGFPSSSIYEGCG